MGQSNKFQKGILLGALAGGLLSLLHKETRVATAQNFKTCFTKVKTVVKDPNIVLDDLKSKTSKIRSSVTQISEDVSFITEKVTELKDVAPEVVKVVTETKTVSAKEDKEDLPNN